MHALTVLSQMAIIHYLVNGFSKHMTAAVLDLLAVVYSDAYTIFHPSYCFKSSFTACSLPVFNAEHRIVLLEPGSPDSRICEVTFAP
jgi:hypothetical protein